MIPTLAALIIAPAATVSMIAPASDTGAWRVYEGEYWQTFEGRRMNQPRGEIVTGGKQPSENVLRDGFQVKRIDPIVNPAPIIGAQLNWARFYGVDGLRIIGATFRFTRDLNQGCGANFRFCKNIRVENSTFILEGESDPSIGGTGYGIVFSACENVTLVNCRVIRCHAGAMFTDGSTNVQVFDTRAENCWMGVSLHGGAVSRALICRFTAVGSGGRIHVGNVTLPDGAANVSVIDSTSPVLEFSGRIRDAKVQGGAFGAVIFNQYRARSNDSQTDYSQTNIELDGSTKVGRVIVKSL